MKRSVAAVGPIVVVVLVLASIVLPRALRAADKSQRQVRIEYALHRLARIASNQYAIWIEDAGGGYIRTLYATRFMARGGYKQRPQCCPVWRERANWADATRLRIDAVAGATPASGDLVVIWDCTDERGRPVPDGIYQYKIEGNLYWGERVLWTGRIEIGPRAGQSEATAVYSPPDAHKSGLMIENVGASYLPAGD